MFWKNKRAIHKISGQLFHEEVLNVLTHLVSVFLFSFLSGIFLYSTGFKLYNILFCLTIINLYSCSVLYHYFENVKLKEKLRILDHSAISLLIAGTYTPYMVLTGNNVMLGIIWTLTATSIFEMLYFWQVNKYILIKYVAMGWMIIFAAKSLFLTLPIWSFIFLLLGGVSYMTGVYFFNRDNVKIYYHTIWHIFVTIGTLLHLISVWIATIN
jgi:hemolysin III